MRFVVPAAAALLLLVAQAQAQTTTPAPAAPAVTTPAAPAAAPKMAKHTWPDEKFDKANVTHDGKLTKDQATAAKWTYVTSHFAAIDKDSKGFVTISDIRAYYKSQHHKKPVAKPATPPATNS